MKLQFSSLAATFVLLLSHDTVAHNIAAQTDSQRDLRIVDSLPRKAKRFALVIGVDEYQDRQITKLDGASNDAKTLADTLIQYCGFPTDQVFIYTGDQSLERRPTRGNILSRLSNLRSVVPKDGLLLVSFSGHGMEREGKGYLLPADAQVNGDLTLLEQTAINADVIKGWIRDMGVAQVIMVIDACRENPSANRGTTNRPLTEAYAHRFSFDIRNREVRAFATLYATEVGQVAYEYKERRLGYFTWALVEGLKGGAADENGEVTLARLVKYIQEAVPKRIRSEIGEEKKQKPFAVIEGYKADDLVVSVVARGASSTTNSTHPGESVDQLTIELRFWDSIKESKDVEDFKAYLRQYPNGKFAEIAKNRIAHASTTSPPPSPFKSLADPPKKETPKAFASEYIFALKSCKLTNAVLICELFVTNDSDRDRFLEITPSSAVYDELGNEYHPSRGRIGSQPQDYTYTATTIGWPGSQIVPRVAITVELRFNNVSAQATTIKLLRINCLAGYERGFSADFRDIPVER